MNIKDITKEVKSLISLYSYQTPPTQEEINEISRYLYIFSEYAQEVIDYIKFNRTNVFYPRLPDFVETVKIVVPFTESFDIFWLALREALRRDRIDEFRVKHPASELIESFLVLEKSNEKEMDYFRRRLKSRYDDYKEERYRTELQKCIRAIRNRDNTK